MIAVSQPDLEAWVWENLKHHKGVTSFSYTSFEEVGGYQWYWGIQVDVRGARKKATADEAEQVRLELMKLPEVAWPDGQITYAQITEGPFWLPDANDGAPRYVMRIDFRVHPILSNTGNTRKESK
jgi:hypothetical protein